MPREAFQRLRDSSFWSGEGFCDVRRESFSKSGLKERRGRTLINAMSSGDVWRRDGSMLAGKEKGGVIAGGFPYGSLEEILDIIVGQLASFQGHEIVQHDVQILHGLNSS